MASVFFNNAKKYFANGAVDWDTDTIKCMLTTSSYSPNIDTHDFRDDVTNEVSGTGYSAGGTALANKTVTADTTNDRAVLDADDTSWATATITARYAVLYKSRGGASSADELIAAIDFGSDIASTGGTFLITWSSNGILTLT